MDIFQQMQAGTIFFNVVGVFREVEENTIRTFSRTMQVNAPSTIKVDNLIISHPSIDVVKVTIDIYNALVISVNEIRPISKVIANEYVKCRITVLLHDCGFLLNTI